MTILALVVMCWGIVLACFGVTLSSDVVRATCLLFAGTALVFGGHRWFLQRSSAEATAVLFSVLGIPVFNRSSCSVCHSRFMAEECSGIRSALPLHYQYRSRAFFF